MSCSINGQGIRKEMDSIPCNKICPFRRKRKISKSLIKKKKGGNMKPEINEKCVVCNKPIKKNAWVKCKGKYFCDWNCLNNFDEYETNKSNIVEKKRKVVEKKGNELRRKKRFRW